MALARASAGSRALIFTLEPREARRAASATARAARLRVLLTEDAASLKGAGYHLL